MAPEVTREIATQSRGSHHGRIVAKGADPVNRLAVRNKKTFFEQRCVGIEGPQDGLDGALWNDGKVWKGDDCTSHMAIHRNGDPKGTNTEILNHVVGSLEARGRRRLDGEERGALRNWLVSEGPGRRPGGT